LLFAPFLPDIADTHEQLLKLTVGLVLRLLC